jgi:hypothetical protein
MSSELGVDSIVSSAGQCLVTVNGLTYFDSCIVARWSVIKEESVHISRTRFAFSKQHDLLYWRNSSLPLKGREYDASTHPILLYGFETLPPCGSYAKQLEVFDHCCLISVAHWLV